MRQCRFQFLIASSPTYSKRLKVQKGIISNSKKVLSTDERILQIWKLENKLEKRLKSHSPKFLRV